MRCEDCPYYWADYDVTIDEHNHIQAEKLSDSYCHFTGDYGIPASCEE